MTYYLFKISEQKLIEFLGKDTGNYKRFKERYNTAKRKLRFKNLKLGGVYA